MRLLAIATSYLVTVQHCMVNGTTPPGGGDQQVEHFAPSQPLPILDHGLMKRQQFTDRNYTGPRYQWYNVSMPIDHFNTSDNRTFNNRYFVNDTYYQEGGPVFWYDYGEGGILDTVADIWLGERDGPTAPMQLARQYHGLVVMGELRYFGKSVPFPLITNNDTFRTREPIGAPESWKYNTVAQGVEDAAYLAKHFDQGDYRRGNVSALLPQNTPWIFIGGSFSGVRAADVRIRK